jgi:DeoR/GlpR family transcriptional regulator of sugar metabolism
MLKEERQQIILEKITNEKKVNLMELSQWLNVSYDSIRRDIIELEDKGLLKKVHGGAVAANAYFSSKTRKSMGMSNPEINHLIKKALPLIEPGQVIIMDGGSTNFCLAEQLPKTLEATIITNNITLALTLSDHPRVEIIMLGGSFFKRYQITMGSATFQELDHLRADLYFMGVTGIDSQQGLTIRHYEESILKRKMMSRSKRVVSCVTAEKINNVDNYRVCGFDEIDVMIASFDTGDAQIAEFENKGVTLL